MIMNELELYIHIPFCIRKCHYCDFLSFAADDDTIEEYVEALVKEIAGASVTYRDRHIISVFIGGGTPTVLSASQICRIMKAVFDNYEVLADAEITIEANPGTVDYEKLKALRECGINRLSIGLQSADNIELKRLGRIHTFEDFEENYRNARKAGFENINIDLINSLPGQTWEDFEKTLLKVIALKPQHISAYSLIVEEGTPVYEVYGYDSPNINAKASVYFLDDKGNLLELPSEEEDRRIYHNTKRLLEENGYCQYEISNFANAGHICRHNEGYWLRRDYLGLGLGASSFVNNSRWKNTSELETYMLISKNVCTNKTLVGEYEWIGKEEAMSETMFLGLRRTEGVKMKSFEEAYGIKPAEIYGEWINKMHDEKLLEEIDDYIRLTDRGMDLANYVMSGFV